MSKSNNKNSNSNKDLSENNNIAIHLPKMAQAYPDRAAVMFPVKKAVRTPRLSSILEVVSAC